MSVIRRFFSISTSVLLLAGSVLAQQGAAQRGGADGLGRPDLFFRAGTGADIMRMKGATGLVGIGTATPSERLEVAGNLKVSGAGNGLVFADGTKQTSAAASTGSTNVWTGAQTFSAGLSAGAGNRVCDTYGVALGNNAKSGGPLINGKCDPDTFNIRGLAAVAIGYNVTADQDHTTALGKFASNNGFQGTFI